MSLAPGMRLGPYEIAAEIGAGGMGVVYRARDTKLNRDVALKVLPESFAFDPERVARFKREAQLRASLNHPNIAAIHGIEESGGTPALVLELVEGPALAERIGTPGPREAAPDAGPGLRMNAGSALHPRAEPGLRTGAGRVPPSGGGGARGGRAGLPLDEALAIAKQIAEALEAAHEHGVIHRDLKPANIKVRDDGTVKVLDFGLAKALEPAGAGRDFGPAGPGDPAHTHSPTITTPVHLGQGYGGYAMTQAGVILGTAAYMAPEQAKGRDANKRCDIWAFGAVLYEMLTGRRAFDGEDDADRRLMCYDVAQ